MKITTDLMNELNQTPHIDQYLKNNEEYIIDLTLSNYLCDRLEKKSLSKTDVIKKADINEIYDNYPIWQINESLYAHQLGSL